ncbi:MAG TPA: ABC transporter substrate-binding protein, partial [Dehalococcoidia bacterium]|nr:ABC transporter substrate-binding protein [Dehalococcoidia bacterium]
MGDPCFADNYWSRLAGGRLSRRRLVQGGAAAAGIAALGLAGCSSSNTNKGAATSAPPATRAASAASPTAAGTASAGGTPAAAAIATAQASLKTGGTVQAVIVGTANLDPVANSTYRSQWLAGFHYGRLFRFAADANPQTTLNRTPVPDLVAGYEVTPDGLTYTMKLRQGVNFHPPLSRAITSADVAASYQYFTGSPKNVNNGVYAPIVDSLSTPDDSTLIWKLKLPYAPFLNKLGNPQYLWIMSKDAATDGKIDPSQQAIGTGPWIFVNSTPTAFTWKKNPDYMLKGLPYADQAVLNIIPDTSTQEAQFQAGRLDILSVQPADVDAMKRAVPKAQVQEYTPNGMSLFFFSNVSDPNSPFKDARMRQAASLAVDRQGLIDAIYSG